MSSASQNPTSAESGPGAGVSTTEKFMFISIQATNGVVNQITRSQARSHAVKQALESKRNRQEKSSDNFRVTTSKDHLKPRKSVNKRTRTRALPMSPFTVSAGMLDPFQALAVDSSRLQTLLANYKARQAPEPVFSVAEELAFHSFNSVFHTGLVDPALLNAVMLSLAFAVTGGTIDRECLNYQGKAISCIRQKMSYLDEATSESTIGAILLLAGVEARLGMTSQVQLHMGAVQLLLETCRIKDVSLTDGIKRAIFWQDLNSAVLAGSSRIFDHTTFAELRWARDRLPQNFFRLPSGFEKRSQLLTNAFIEVLEDINALQCIRDTPWSTKSSMEQMALVNNHTASIQSRLVGLPNLSTLLDCCHLAAYLCSVMLCCTVWCALTIPSHVCSQLLYKLQQANDDPIWDDHPALLLWVLYIGGAFAPEGDLRSGYVVLLRSNNAVRFVDLYKAWPELLGILKQFIWSEKAFLSHFKALWEETLI